MGKIHKIIQKAIGVALNKTNNTQRLYEFFERWERKAQVGRDWRSFSYPADWHIYGLPTYYSLNVIIAYAAFNEATLDEFLSEIRNLTGARK
jgi:hypothetical protein